MANVEGRSGGLRLGKTREVKKYRKEELKESGKYDFGTYDKLEDKRKKRQDAKKAK